MIIIEPSYEILTPIDGIAVLKQLEKIGRICYKSEEKISDDSYINFIKNIIKRGHEAIIEHFSVSVKFICDRGVSHEIVRHRIASFAQESTRYCNYSNDSFGNELTFILPFFLTTNNEIPKNISIYLNKYKNDAFSMWLKSMNEVEDTYFKLLAEDYKPQEARSVLPNSLKTEIVMTANLREWRHFLKLRASITAHPQMRQLAIPLLCEFHEKIPVIFDDVKYFIDKEMS